MKSRRPRPAALSASPHREFERLLQLAAQHASSSKPGPQRAAGERKLHRLSA
jgi:hypothetical protein